jgi:hypothetical protein
MFCESETGVVVTITNQASGTWTQVADSPQDSAATRLTVFWSRYNGTQTAPTASTSTATHICLVTVSFIGCVTDGDPWNVTSGGTDTTSDTSLNATGDTTTVADCLVVVACSTGQDANNAQFTAWGSNELTPVLPTNLPEADDVCTNLGGGGGVGVAYGGKAVAGTYNDTTATLANASTKGFITIALKPAVMTSSLQPNTEMSLSMWRQAILLKQYLYPTWFSHIEPISAVMPVSMDMWHRETERQRAEQDEVVSY